MHKFLGIGINEYPGAPLSGCLSDESTNERKLVDPRYASAEGWTGKRLLNARANKATILDRLNWLFDAADFARLTFSGHGTEQVSQGKLQHAACPVDFCFDEDHTLWLREIANLLRAKGQKTKTFIFWDSCHAEFTENDRDMMGIAGLRVEPRSYPLFSQPDIIAENMEARRSGNDIGSPLLRAVQNGDFPCCYIAGCGATQTSADVQDASGAYGAATHYFWQVMDFSPLSRPMSEVVRLANQALARDNFEQVMQCEGTLKDLSIAEIFGV
jgi:hypothetical protein